MTDKFLILIKEVKSSQNPLGHYITEEIDLDGIDNTLDGYKIDRDKVEVVFENKAIYLKMIARKEIKRESVGFSRRN